MRLGKKTLSVLCVSIAMIAHAQVPAHAVAQLVESKSTGDSDGPSIWGTGTGYHNRESTNTNIRYSQGRATTYGSAPGHCTELWIDYKGGQHNTPYVYINCAVAQTRQSSATAFTIRYVGNNNTYIPNYMAVAMCTVPKGPMYNWTRSPANCTGERGPGPTTVDVYTYSGRSHADLAALPANERPHILFP